MNWIVLPRGSNTESNLSDSLRTSEKPLVDPQVLPISEAEEILHDKLFNLVIKDDVDSDNCMVDNAKNSIQDRPDGKKDTGNNFDGAEGSDSVSFKTVPDGATADNSPLLAPNLGQSYLNPGESSKGESVEPKHHCNVPLLDFGPTEKHVAFDSTNYYYLNFKDDRVEHRYEADLRLAKKIEMKRMHPDDDSLFRAVASQVYGNSELHYLTRETCRVFMVYGDLYELRAIACAYNRPIHIYYYSTDPVQVVFPPYTGNSTPIRLSCHVGGHYNSLIDLSRELPVEGLAAARHARFPGGRMMNSFEVNHYAFNKWIHNSPRGSSTAKLIEAVLAWKAGAELNLGGSIVVGSISNCIELAMTLGFEFHMIAAAYSIFKDDGSSLLYNLFASDTYAREIVSN